MEPYTRDIHVIGVEEVLIEVGDAVEMRAAHFALRARPSVLIFQRQSGAAVTAALRLSDTAASNGSAKLSKRRGVGELRLRRQQRDLLADQRIPKAVVALGKPLPSVADFKIAVITRSAECGRRCKAIAAIPGQPTAEAVGGAWTEPAP